MKMNKFFIMTVLLLFNWSSFAESSKGTYVVKVRKSQSASANSKNMKKVGSDQNYNYYEVTAAEMDIIVRARMAYEEGKSSPASKHMRDKMQDQVGEED